MARITRSSILLWLQDLLGIQGGVDSVPQYLASQVVPVVDIQPKITTILKSSSATLTGETTVYTTPPNKKFFLTYVDVHYTKDSTSDGTQVYCLVTVGGLSTTLTKIRFIAGSAGTDHKSIVFSYPILIDSNTAIKVAGYFTAGTQTREMTIGGYILE